MALKTKQKTELIFDKIRQHGFTPIDIQYSNSYFIFEHGKDKVVSFHIKEIKGWKFGIWWNCKGKSEFDFFGQYEKTIDKFKPSASGFVEWQVEFGTKRLGFNLDYVLKMLRFIKKHPYVAWAYDQYGFMPDPWVSYETDFSAWRKYVANKWKYEIRASYVHEKLRKQYLKIVEQILDDHLANGRVYDGNKNGWRCSPRYHIVCDDAKGENLARGHYTLMVEELEPKLQKRVEHYNKKFKKAEKKYGWELGDIYFGDALPFTVKDGK